MERPTPAVRAGCFTWVDDGEGGYCEETDAEADARYMDLIADDDEYDEYEKKAHEKWNEEQERTYEEDRNTLDCEDFVSQSAAQDAW